MRPFPTTLVLSVLALLVACGTDPSGPGEAEGDGIPVADYSLEGPP